jgi:hypothetical protein
VLGGLARERLVVDETDLLEALQLGSDLVGLEPGAEEPDLELTARPRPNREQS